MKNDIHYYLNEELSMMISINLYEEINNKIIIEFIKRLYHNLINHV